MGREELRDLDGTFVNLRSIVSRGDPGLADLEAVQMGVLPPHHDLDHFVQGFQRDRTGTYASPDFGMRPLQADPERVIDVIVFWNWGQVDDRLKGRSRSPDLLHVRELRPRLCLLQT